MNDGQKREKKASPSSKAGSRKKPSKKSSKKSSSKKVSGGKASGKKSSGKKVAARESRNQGVSKKGVSKKVTGKKGVSKKVVASKKASGKKAGALKRPAAPKASSGKAARKTPAKKPSAKKASAKKASPAKKPAAKKSAVKKSAVKKPAVQKASPPKGAKKAPARKPAVKSPAAKPAAKSPAAKRSRKKAGKGGSNSAIPGSPPPSSGLSRSILQLSGGSRTDQRRVRYLTIDELIELHQAVAAEFGGTQAQPGEVDSDFALRNAVERPQATIFGRDAYPRFFEKAAAFFFALVQNLPFHSANRRLAVAALVAFCELNDRTIDFRALDEKTIEQLTKRASTYREKGVPAEDVFSEIREVMYSAISPPV